MNIAIVRLRNDPQHVVGAEHKIVVDRTDVTHRMTVRQLPPMNTMLATAGQSINSLRGFDHASFAHSGSSNSVSTISRRNSTASAKRYSRNAASLAGRLVRATGGMPTLIRGRDVPQALRRLVARVQ